LLEMKREENLKMSKQQTTNHKQKYWRNVISKHCINDEKATQTVRRFS